VKSSARAPRRQKRECRSPANAASPPSGTPAPGQETVLLLCIIYPLRQSNTLQLCSAYLSSLRISTSAATLPFLCLRLPYHSFERRCRPCTRRSCSALRPSIISDERPETTRYLYLNSKLCFPRDFSHPTSVFVPSYPREVSTDNGKEEGGKA
jgi:hypothetical protein